MRSTKNEQQELKRIHQQLELSDRGAIPEDLDLNLDEAYFERLHNRIMAQVEKTEIEPPPRFNGQVLVLGRYWRKYSRPVTRATMSLALVLLGAGYLITQLTQETPILEQQTTLVRESVIRSSEFSASVLNSQTELDFVSDVASASNLSLSAEDLL